MKMDRDYEMAVARARENLADLQGRGDAALGGTWEDFEKELFTPEEIAASDARVAMVGESIKVVEEKSLSRKRLRDLMEGVDSLQSDAVFDGLAMLKKALMVAPCRAGHTV